MDIDAARRARRRCTTTRLAGAVIALVFSACAWAQADYAREQRWADEISPTILVGDPVRLKLASGRTFLAIHAPADKAKAGVVVVHGLGVHPDWGLINPLRSELPDAGYATLSVQMPVLAADARGEQYAAVFPEAAERLQAAVAFLRARGHARVGIVSHSMGSRMTNEFLGRSARPDIDAWVAIGLSGTYTQPERISMPVLDLFGEKDLPAVRQGAAVRAAVISKVRGSAQVEVAGADHFFDGMNAELVRRVRQFLDQRLR